MVVADGCADTPAWDNHSGKKCIDYVTERWCGGGRPSPGFEWTFGPQFNHPDQNCCACGKPTNVGEDSELQGAHTSLQSLTQARASQCQRMAPASAGNGIALYVPRLPRSGNAFMCALLGGEAAARTQRCLPRDPTSHYALLGGEAAVRTQHCLPREPTPHRLCRPCHLRRARTSRDPLPEPRLCSVLEFPGQGRVRRAGRGEDRMSRRRDCRV